MMTNLIVIIFITYGLLNFLFRKTSWIHRLLSILVVFVLSIISFQNFPESNFLYSYNTLLLLTALDSFCGKMPDKRMYFWKVSYLLPFYFLCFSSNVLLHFSAIIFCSLINSCESFGHVKKADLERIKITNYVFLILGVILFFVSAEGIGASSYKILDEDTFLVGMVLFLIYTLGKSIVTILENQKGCLDAEYCSYAPVWLTFVVIHRVTIYSWELSIGGQEFIRLAGIICAFLVLFYCLLMSFEKKSKRGVSEVKLDVNSFAWTPYILIGVDSIADGYYDVLILVSILASLMILSRSDIPIKSKLLKFFFTSHGHYFSCSISFVILIRLFFIMINQERLSWAFLLLFAYIGYNIVGVINLKKCSN